MKAKSYIAIIPVLLILVVHGLYAQNNRRNNTPPVVPDSSLLYQIYTPVDIPESERVGQFYDSLRSKTAKSGFTNLFYKALFRRSGRDTIYQGIVLDEAAIYHRFQGRSIGDVRIERIRVFENPNSWIERTGNKLHRLTRERVVRRDLMFKAGDRLDAQTIVTNKRFLINRDYIADADIYVLPRMEDTTVVDIIVRTKDKWTISADGDWGGEGRTTLELFDANLFGSGNRLSVHTNFDRRDFSYQGNIVEYNIPNVMGTFWQANAFVGRYFYDRDFRVKLYKEFIAPTDYDAGVDYRNDRLRYYRLWDHSHDTLKVRNIDIWFGKSHYVKGLNSSIYFSTRYGDRKFTRRPTVGLDMNPAYHNHHEVMFSLGLYREKFYTTNMIFGYGNKEYLPSGFRAELIAGYNWGEFRNDPYFGMGFHTGGFNSLGYMRAGIDFGSYVDRDKGKLYRGTLDIDLKWFSNLYRIRRSDIRQFISINHTRGIKRGTGADETLKFTEENGPKTITEWLIGTNRTVLNTETVVFTPLQPYGFRMAIFGFADIGLLGNQRSIFDNRFFSTIGFGIRLKNERLVFNTLQLRLGIALGKNGFIHNQYMRVSTEQRVSEFRFIPNYPQTVPYE